MANLTVLERLAIAGAALCGLDEGALNAALDLHDIQPVNHNTYVANKYMADKYRSDPDFMLAQILHPASFGAQKNDK